jgi:ElaB/YqjD/DUF883 family membrane-anchored ribosome-binding protein
MSTKNGGKIGTDNLVGDLRDDVAETRESLDTVGDLTQKADAKTRTRDAVQHVATQARDGGQQAAEQVNDSVRRHPARWASIGAGVVAVAATVGALRWRQARHTPRGRTERLWHGVTKRFGR